MTWKVEASLRPTTLMRRSNIGMRSVFIAALMAAMASFPAAAAAPKEWTVLIFMNGKNNLEAAALNDFRELAAVGSSNDVDFVVELGRPDLRPGEQAQLKAVDGGWTGARRFHVTKGQTPAPGQEVGIVGTGSQVDMGSRDTLAAFLKWGKATYPAKRYAVVIWNHGQGYRLTFPADGAQATVPAPVSAEILKRYIARNHRAVSQDVDTNSIIYNSDLRVALTSAFGPELRLVGFDACLMAMMETAYQLRDVAPVMVASEELEPGDGWDYTGVARYFIGNPRQDEAQIASGIVSSYAQTWGNSEETTMSAVRLGQAKTLAPGLSALSAALIADQDTLFPIVAAARAERGTYNAPQDPVTIDLIGFLNRLEARLAAGVPTSPALALTRKARDAAKQLVIADYASSKRGEPYGSYGLAIYFPSTIGAFRRDPWGSGYLRSNQDRVIDFVANEKWSLFLQAYLGLPQ